MDVLTRERFPHRAEALADRYPEIRSILNGHGMPPYWKRPERYETLFRIILEQQVSVRSAATLAKRVEAELGGLSARRVAAAGAEGLRELGLTRAKARSSATLAEAVRSRSLRLGRLREASTEVLIAELTRWPGIGPWTAWTYTLLAQARADAWPPGDLALRRAIEELLPASDVDQLTATGGRWQGERGIAARLLWHFYLSTRAR
ncbi:MAG: DNA-3-methyladenine glycosylase 2 family protein [Pseudomonadota bacterium]